MSNLINKQKFEFQMYNKISRVIALLGFIYFGNIFIQQNGYSTSFLSGVAVLAIIYIIALRLSSASIVAISLFLSIGFAIYLESKPVGDFFSNFYNVSGYWWKPDPTDALIFAAKSPSSDLYFVIFHKIFGFSQFATYLAPLSAWFLGSFFIYKSLSVDGDSLKSKIMLAFLLLNPLYIIYITLYSHHVTFHFYLGACLYILVNLFRSKSMVWVFLMGIFMGLLFFARPNGLFIWILSAGLLFNFMIAKSPVVVDYKKVVKRMIYAFAIFSVFPLIYGSINYSINGEFKLTASKSNSYYFLYGTNVGADGRWNQSDIDSVGLPSKENEAKALDIAIDRITSNPQDFLIFAFTKKIKALWGGQDAFIDLHTLKSSEDKQELVKFIRAIILSIQAISILAFAVLSFIYIFKINLAFTPWLVTALLFSSLHIFVEVMEQYTIPIYTIMCIGVLTSLRKLTYNYYAKFQKKTT